MGRRTLALTPAHRVYRLLARLLWPLAMAWLWWRGRREPLYAQRLRERLGYCDAPAEASGGILVHAASVGEVQAARPLIAALRHNWPAHSLTVSTVTPTGLQALRDHWGPDIRHAYLPLDTAGATARFLDRLRPRLLVLMEREIWPELLWQCALRCIPVVVVNARLSERSARSYRRWHRLFGPVWPRLSLVLAADADSAARYAGLGVPEERCLNLGNLKFDLALDTDALAGGRETGLAGRQVVVAGSTHVADEEALLAVWTALWQACPTLLLVLVPRHPQRFDEVARRLERSGLPFVRHSLGQLATAGTAVWLGDTMGELPRWYCQADLCFIGGSLAPVGGHNPLEAMAFGKPVLFGPHTQNFEPLYETIVTCGAGVRVPSADALADQVRQACQNMTPFAAMGRHGEALVRQHQGATRRTLDAMAPLQAGHVPDALGRIRETASDDVHLWFDPALVPELQSAEFDQTGNASRGQPMATGSGRGQVHLVEMGQTSVVLRHYRRGGLMARLSRDRFLGRDPWRSRAMREFLLLRLMRSWGLPVPVPVAARCVSAGWTYRADIMVQTIPGARNMVQCLGTGPLAPAFWQAFGQAIRRLHDHQVFHADLNAHNLLLDDAGQAWVVDFDKCEQRPGEDWKQANLQRLLRSLRKEKDKRTAPHWDDADWQQLLAAYAQDPQAFERT
jgi:3-deoxy-D-manno-octulosonic-acid transferase